MTVVEASVFRDLETMRIRAPTLSLASYESYLKGMYYLNKSSVEDLQKGISFFEEGVERNPAVACSKSHEGHGAMTAGEVAISGCLRTTVHTIICPISKASQTRSRIFRWSAPQGRS